MAWSAWFLSISNDDNKLIHSKTSNLLFRFAVVACFNILLKQRSALTDSFAFWLSYRHWLHSKDHENCPTFTLSHESILQISWILTSLFRCCFVFINFRSKPNTPVSFAIWCVRSLVMLRMRSDAWNCWKSPRISAPWSSAKLVWAHTSVASGSEKNCPTSWHKCVRLATQPNKPFFVHDQQRTWSFWSQWVHAERTFGSKSIDFVGQIAVFGRIDNILSFNNKKIESLNSKKKIVGVFLFLFVVVRSFCFYLRLG